MFTGHSIASDRSISLCVWPSTIGWWVADLWFNLIVDEVKMSEDESKPQSMQLTAYYVKLNKILHAVWSRHIEPQKQQRMKKKQLQCLYMYGNFPL